eukprot:6484663-Amphidinium_carterae.1
MENILYKGRWSRKLHGVITVATDDVYFGSTTQKLCRRADSPEELPKVLYIQRWKPPCIRQYAADRVCTTFLVKDMKPFLVRLLASQSEGSRDHSCELALGHSRPERFALGMLDLQTMLPPTSSYPFCRASLVKLFARMPDIFRFAGRSLRDLAP